MMLTSNVQTVHQKLNANKSMKVFLNRRLMHASIFQHPSLLYYFCPDSYAIGDYRINRPNELQMLVAGTMRQALDDIFILIFIASKNLVTKFALTSYLVV